MIEFDCAHCGVHVHEFGRAALPSPPLCAMCGFIAEQPAEEREELARLAFKRDPEAFEAWQAAASIIR